MQQYKNVFLTSIRRRFIYKPDYSFLIICRNIYAGVMREAPIVAMIVGCIVFFSAASEANDSGLKTCGDIEKLACKAMGKEEKLYNVECKEGCSMSGSIQISYLDKAKIHPSSALACMKFVGQDIPWSLKPGELGNLPLRYPLDQIVGLLDKDTNLANLFVEAQNAKVDMQVEIAWMEGGGDGKECRKQNDPLVLDLDASIGSITSSGKKCRKDITDTCTLGDDISINVYGLQNLKSQTGQDPSSLRLVVNGIKLSKIIPSVVVQDNKLTYDLSGIDAVDDLRRIKSSLYKDAEKISYIELTNDRMSINSKFAMKIGVEYSAYLAFLISKITTTIPFFIGLGIVFFLAGLIILAISFGAARDSYISKDFFEAMNKLPNKELDNDESLTEYKMAYSLGRTQMLFWTIIVLVSWLIIFMATGEWFPLNAQSLILMGISAGTAIGARAVMPEELKTLIKTAQDAETFPKETLTKIKEMTKSDDFFKDIFREFGSESASLYRIQTVIFTIIGGLFFLYFSCLDAVMPQIQAELISLMGISNLVYVGFKKIGTQ